ncbi:MutS domain V protein, partial [Anaerococcus hydrogenalis]
MGLVAAMNQAGLFIPVAGRAVLPIFQNIWVAIGDEQNMAENLSTFSGHMSRLIQIMKDAGSNDLVLLDELGSGTDPVEGAALAIAILEYFHRLGALAMVTTHYSELKQYVYTHPGMENAHVEFDDETLTPTYRLQIGIAGNSQALNITKRLGMLPEVLARAQELKQASAYYEMETVLEELNHKRRELSRMEEDLQTRLAKAEKSHAKWNENNQELQRKKQAILQKARDDARQLKRELKVNAEQIIKDLKRSAKEAKDKQQAVVDEKRQAIDRLSIPNANERTKIPLRKIEIGQAVYVDTLEKVGTVIDIQGKQFKVDLAGLPITVAGRNLFYPLPQEAKPKEIKTKEQIRSKTVAPKMRMAAQSINLIGETV